MHIGAVEGKQVSFFYFINGILYKKVKAIGKRKKYFVRFCLTPRNDAQQNNVGYTIPAATAAKVGILRMGTVTFKNGTTTITTIPSTGVDVNLGGTVAWTNSDSIDYPSVLVLSRFSSDGILLDVKSATVTMTKGSAVSNGIKTGTANMPAK